MAQAEGNCTMQESMFCRDARVAAAVAHTAVAAGHTGPAAAVATCLVETVPAAAFVVVAAAKDSGHCYDCSQAAAVPAGQVAAMAAVAAAVAAVAEAELVQDPRRSHSVGHISVPEIVSPVAGRHSVAAMAHRMDCSGASQVLAAAPKGSKV